MTKKNLKMAMMKVSPLTAAVIALAVACPGAVGAEPLERISPPPPFLTDAVPGVLGTPRIGVIHAMRNAGGVKSVPVRHYGVVCGGNKLVFEGRGESTALQLTLNRQDRPLATFSYWGATEHGWGHPFQGDEPTVEFDEAAQAIRVTKKFRANSEHVSDGAFTQDIQLLDDGRVEIRYQPVEPPHTRVTDKGVFVGFPRFDDIAGMTFQVNGETNRFSDSDAPRGKRELFRGLAESFALSPDDPKRGFSITFPTPTALAVTESREPGEPGGGHVSVRVTPATEGSLSFKLDIRNISESMSDSPDTFANIDFWRDDRLHIPDYGKSRNLAPNPSFEGGLRYYTLQSTWGTFGHYDEPTYSIDETTARTGRRSLKLIANREQARPGYLQTFALPTVPGRPYTVSFHARASRDTGLMLRQVCVSGVWKQFPKVPAFSIVNTNEWKRYHYTVTAPNNALTFLWMPEHHGEGSGTIWMDDLQIEEGDQPTDYIHKPVSAQLLTSDPDNFLRVDAERMDARLVIHAPPETRGVVSCVLEDFFYHRPWSRSFEFATNPEGVAQVDLPLDGVLGTGIYVLRADFELSDGYRDTDFFRLSRMRFLGNTHQHKNIFASEPTARNFRGMDVLERFRNIGIGASQFITPATLREEAARFGMESMTGKILYREFSGYFEKHGRTISHYTGIAELSVEDEAAMENIAHDIARDHPGIRRFALRGEMEGTGLVKHGNGRLRDFARMQIAAAKGVRRADPDVRFFLGGASNMDPRAGIRYVDEYLDATEAVDPAFRYDGFTMHPYRRTPESPDLDRDAAFFIRMLAKHNYHDAPIHWDEGIYHTHYHIPAWGLDPHRGCSTDHYRARCPSYHMGWGERIAAAYYARSWLVALKYQDRIPVFDGWAGWNFMDAYLTPLAVQKIPNTLGHLLGNAAFRQDIRFAPDVRSYVFEDEASRPVAAVWSHIDAVDRGFASPPIAEIDLTGQAIEVFDLMGNRHLPPIGAGGRTTLPVTSFPVFLRGDPGSLEALVGSLSRAVVPGADGDALHVSSRLMGESTLRLVIENRVSAPFEGRVKIDGTASDLALQPTERRQVDVALKKPVPHDRIEEVSKVATLEPRDGVAFETQVGFEAFAVSRLEGDHPDWASRPRIPIVNFNVPKTVSSAGVITILNDEPRGHEGDFDAWFQVGWTDDALCLRVGVTDDVFVQDESKAPELRWYGDSLQLYIDTMADGRQKDARGFDENDYNYDFYGNSDGSIIAFRRFAPDQQAAGGLDAPRPMTVDEDVKGTFQKTEDGYVYDIVIPSRLLVPLSLKAGSVCGFSLYLNDRDDEHVKQGLSLTPPGTGGYMKPHLYPIMLLTE